MPYANWIQRARKLTHKKRLELFYGFLKKFNRKPIRIIDLGGTVTFWKNWAISDDGSLQITLINNHHIDKEAVGYDNSLKYIQEIIKDATTLNVDDYKNYDVIFSNSMIEHLESWDMQKKICQEIENSGISYFIQIPNKKSIIDPHFPHLLVPFFAMYPKKLQAYLLTIHGFNGGRSMSYPDSIVRMGYYNPIDERMLRKLLPGGNLVPESFLGMSASLIMTKG